VTNLVKRVGLKKSAAPRHAVRHLQLEVAGWPQCARPLRIVFFADLHTGSHSNDVKRLSLLIDEAASLTPDLALFGGDYVNMQLIGGGRVPPHTIAAVLSRLEASLGRFAVLGNHDYVYGERAVSDALRDRKITVLDRDRSTVQFHNYSIQIVGVPDGCINSDKACSPTGCKQPLSSKPLAYVYFKEALSQHRRCLRPESPGRGRQPRGSGDLRARTKPRSSAGRVLAPHARRRRRGQPPAPGRLCRRLLLSF
jgi:Calcineurin-like phosphoesterase